MTRLGILLRDLGHSWMGHCLVRSANAFLATRPDVSLTAFVQEPRRALELPHFAVMQAAEAWGFPGALVATNFRTAHALLRMPSPAKKLFYAWDLEWAWPRPGNWAYVPLRDVYGSPELTLLARCEDHRKVLEEAFNRPVPVVPDFSLPLLMSHVEAARDCPVAPLSTLPGVAT